MKWEKGSGDEWWLKDDDGNWAASVLERNHRFYAYIKYNMLSTPYATLDEAKQKVVRLVLLRIEKERDALNNKIESLRRLL